MVVASDSTNFEVWTSTFIDVGNLECKIALALIFELVKTYMALIRFVVAAGEF